MSLRAIHEERMKERLNQRIEELMETHKKDSLLIVELDKENKKLLELSKYEQILHWQDHIISVLNQVNDNLYQEIIGNEYQGRE